MARTVGYMLTWRTYGTWLPEEGLGQYCREQMKSGAVRLDGRARALVHRAIVWEAKRWGERIEALAVSSEHVHMVVRYGGRPIDEFAGACKAAGRIALKSLGHTVECGRTDTINAFASMRMRCGHVWSMWKGMGGEGGERRFCEDFA